MKSVFSEILLFLKKHWIHILIGIPMVVGWTILHELAHCVAAWVQGGNVTEFVWLPSAQGWGHMRYSNSEFTPLMGQLVSLAPYFLWTALCLVAVLLSRRSGGWSFKGASTIFVWLFIVPVADMANTAVPYVLWGRDNDFYSAFGAPGLLLTLGIAVFGLLLFAGGFALNKRLYRDSALGACAYTTLAAVAGTLVVGITWGA